MRWAVWLGVFASVASMLTLAPGAAADARPLLVVVESAPDRTARAIREGIARESGRTVVALGDDGAERASATLNLTLSDDRRSAWAYYRNDDRPRYERLSAPADAPRGVEWLAVAAAGLVRRAEADRGDWSIADEVIDPFEGEPARPRADMRLPPEIIDPWERPGGQPRSPLRELGSDLGAPRPRR